MDGDGKVLNSDGERIIEKHQYNKCTKNGEYLELSRKPTALPQQQRKVQLPPEPED